MKAWTVLVLSFLIDLSYGGQISGWHVSVDYSNPSLTSQLDITFQLENNIEGTDYLVVKLPFNLHSSLTGTIPSGIVVTYNSSFTCSTVLTSKLTADLNYINSQYYVNFYDSNKVPCGLIKNQLYTIQIRASGANFPTNPVNNLNNIVTLMTVSSVSSGALAYDSNPIFSQLYFVTSVTPSLIYQVFIKNAEQQLPGKKYSLQLDIFNGIQTKSPVKFRIFTLQSGLVTTKDFLFSIDNCTSIAKGFFDVKVNQLKSSEYKCFLNSELNYIEIQVYKNFAAGEWVSFSISIQNPLYVVTGVGLQIRKMYLESNEVIEIANKANVFSVGQRTLASSEMKLAWGIPVGAQICPGHYLNIINMDSLSVKQTYNQIKFEFQLDSATALGLQLEIEINLRTSTLTATSQVLEGSLFHNLPIFDYGKGEVNCAFMNNNQASAYRYLLCKNVGQLEMKTYFVAFKMLFQYDAGESNLHSDFSKLSIYSYNPTLQTRDSLLVLDPVNLKTNIQTKNNQRISTSTSYSTIASTMIDDDSTTMVSPASSGGILGLLVSNSYQKLIFSSYIPYTLYTSALSGSESYNVGLIIVMNPKIQINAATSQFLNQGSATSFNVNFRSVPSSSQSLGYNQVQIDTPSSTDLDSILYSSIYAYTMWGFSKVMINQHQNVQSDDSLLDFYMCFSSQINKITPSPQSMAHFNSYTVNSPKPFYIKHSIVNWYSSSGQSNNGDNIPTFLRISGYFTETDLKGGLDKLMIFFSGVSFFYHENDPLNKTIGCGSSLGQISCLGYDNFIGTPADDYMNYKRVEVWFPNKIPFGSVNPFEILIPVSTTTSLYGSTLALGTLSAQATDVFLNYTTSYKLNCLYQLTGDNNLVDHATEKISFISTDFPNSATLPYAKTGITINNYGLDLSNSQVGQLATSINMNIFHSDTSSVIGVNSLLSSDSYNGAGFTFNCEWPFQSSQTQILWGGGIPSQFFSCIQYSYNKNAASPSYRYGFYCPLESSAGSTLAILKVTNFQLPYTYGKQLPTKTSFAFSTKNGILATLQVIPNIVIGKTGIIYSDLHAVKPPLPQGTNSNRLIFTFSTTNPVPNAAKFNIIFQSAYGFVVTSATCMLYQSQTSTCAVTATSTTILTFAISSCSECPLRFPSYQLMLYGISGLVGVQADIRFKLNMVTSSDNIIDETQATLGYPSIFRYYSSSGPLEFGVGGTMGQTNFRASSMSQIKIDFWGNSREILKNEIVFIDLGSFVAVTTEVNNVFCQVFEYDSQGQLQLSHSWKSIDISSLSGVQLQAKFDINVSGQKFSLQCRNIKVPTTIPAPPGITLKTSGLTDIQTIKQTTANTITSAALMSPAVTLAKPNFNLITLPNLLTFTLTLTSDSKTIQVGFPKYYLPRLTQDDSLYCKISSTKVGCSVLDDYLLEITNLPTGATAITLYIYGVTQPPLAFTGKFFVGLYGNDATLGKTLLKHGEVNDIASTSLNLGSIGPLQIGTFNLLNQFIKTSNTYNFTITIPNSYLTSGLLLLSFPREWRSLLEYQIPSVRIKRIADNQLLTINSIILTDMLYISFSGTNPVATNTDYFLLIAGIVNPETEICFLGRKWQIFLATSLTSLGLISYNQNAKIPEYTFSQQLQLQALKWDYPQNQGYFVVRRGPFRTQLVLGVEGIGQNVWDQFLMPLKIALSDTSQFLLTPEQPFVASGQNRLTFFIEALADTPSGNFSVYFSKVADHFNKYTLLPICKIQVIDTALSVKVLKLDYFQAFGTKIFGIKPAFIFQFLLTRIVNIFSIFSSISVSILFDLLLLLIFFLKFSSLLMYFTLFFEFFFAAYSINHDLLLNILIIQKFNVAKTFVPRDGYSSPVILSLMEDAFLKEQFSVLVSIANSETLGIIPYPSTLSTTGVLFTNNKAQIQFYASTTSIVGTLAIATLSLSNYNSGTIIQKLSVPSSIQVEIIQINQKLVNFYVNFVTLTADYQNTTLIVDCDTKYSTIFYKIIKRNSQLPFDYSVLQQEITTNALSFYEYNKNSADQTQYGLINTNDFIDNFLTIPLLNLIQNFEYRILAIGLNFKHKYSGNVLDHNFTTPHIGELKKINFNFSTNLVYDDYIKLTCFTCMFFGLPQTNVYTDNFISCKPKSQQYDFTYTSSEAKPYGNVVKQTLVSLYIIPNLLDQDQTSMQSLINKTSLSTYIFQIQRFTSDNKYYDFSEWGLELVSPNQVFPDILSVSQLSIVSSGQITFAPYSYLDIYFNGSVFNIIGIVLQQPGYFIVGVASLSQDVPLVENLRLGKFNNGTSFDYGVHLTKVLPNQNSFIQLQAMPVDSKRKFSVFCLGVSDNPGLYSNQSFLRTSVVMQNGLLVKVNFALNQVQSLLILMVVILII